MRIGILTYHRVHNYGAVLQAYALSTFLQSQGHTVEFVDYWPDYFADKYSLLYGYALKGKPFIVKIKTIIKLIFAFSRILKRQHGFKRFIREYLNIGDNPVFNSGKTITTRFDAVVYGSDQIWRKQNHGQCKSFDYVYFAENNIIAAKHISYAASMGVINLNDQERESLSVLLKKFSHIMVREHDLSDLVNSLGFQASVVLDPVFLLRLEEWQQIIPKKVNKTDYILFYHNNCSSEAISLVDILSKHHHYTVKVIRFGVSPFDFGRNECQTANPLEFLYLFNNASFVVCTSFHGVAFSIIFKKQFYVLGLGKSDGRIKTLLSTLNIADRYLENIDNLDLNSIVDYKKVADILPDRISESKSKLLNSLVEHSIVSTETR